MRITICSDVSSTVSQIVKKFDKTLFLQLKPPLTKLELLRFDGCRKGDEVHLELDLLITKQRWISLITDSVDEQDRFSFTDEGIQLPFFLQRWLHNHHIEKKDETHATIIDDVEFSAPWWLPDVILYPVLYLQLRYRKPVYQRIFGKPRS